MLSEEGFIHIIDNSKFEKPITIYSKKFSESCQSEERIFYNNKRAALYKTEMCRSFSELGTCKYGDSCQFCHSEAELRIVERHPKYKTEICRTFWLEGSCPYGKRCCFAHLDNVNLIEKAKMLGIKQKVGTSVQDNAQLSPFLLDIDDGPSTDADNHFSSCLDNRTIKETARNHATGHASNKDSTMENLIMHRPLETSELKNMYFASNFKELCDGEVKSFTQDLLSKKDEYPGRNPSNCREYFTFNRYYSGCFEPAVLDSAKNADVRYVSIWRRNTLKVWCDEPLNFILDISEINK